MGIRVIWGLLSAAAFDGGDQWILLGIGGLSVFLGTPFVAADPFCC
jgi:hypothetical protein